ncbi:MAG: molybdopterin-dependent oxidoreductase [Candidatus Dehalobacter alkaniphilus]|uniref:molybdopterin-containing oxidoreductase family protein n=1 Tax=Dehalobacter sp. DCM TaxID=2907827 RepID=UPI003081C3E3|nr:molybdopterin-dependent oxidoreductase [Dehalobacter sp. DCM]
MTAKNNGIQAGTLGLTMDEALALAQKNGEQVVPAFCAMCGPTPMCCGIYAFVKEGRFTKAAGMREFPTNQGALCPKGQAAPQWVHSPDRLRYPLRRVGKKGEGKFEKITWEEAVGIVADTLKRQKEQYGPESLAILAPAMRTYNAYIKRFLTVHGSPNYGHSGICALQRAFSFMYTLGDWPQAEINQSDLIIYWGRQPIFSGPAMSGPRMLLKARERGARIIAVKPSVESDVSKADIWVPLRPGTDAALALAMLYVVVNEELIDKEFVQNWCYGYEHLKEHIQKYPPEWAEEITGVPAKQIEKVARLYATTKRASIDLGNGVEHAPSANDAIRSIAILIAITGHLDRPGGNVFTIPDPAQPMPLDITMREWYTREMVEKLVGPEFPKQFQPFVEGFTSAYYRVLESVLTESPYPVRTIIAPGTQPGASTRGSKRVIEALKKLDFYVVVDVARTADMDYADIVIPVTTSYESDHPFEAVGGRLMARNKIIEPLGDYHSIYKFFLDLAFKMGYGTDFWNGSMEQSMNDQLQPFGLTLAELRKYPTGFVYEKPVPRTYENYRQVFTKKSPRLNRMPFLPHGKVEIYNTSFEEAGFTPLPVWREPPESLTGTPQLTSKYPLILSDYHTSKNYTASWQRNVPYLRELQPDPAIHIHPDTATARGIQDGDWVIVESPHGWLKVKAEFYPGIRPDTVMILHGWWQGCKELGLADYPLLDGGANVNIMYSLDPEKTFDLLITAMSSQTLVEVKKA